MSAARWVEGGKGLGCDASFTQARRKLLNARSVGLHVHVWLEVLDSVRSASLALECPIFCHGL